MTRLLSILILLALCGCTLMTEKFIFSGNNPSGVLEATPGETDRDKRSGLAPDSEAVVLPSDEITLSVSWAHPGTDHFKLTYWVDGVTNTITTTEWGYTLKRPNASRVFGYVTAVNAQGLESEPSKLAFWPLYPADRMRVQLEYSADLQSWQTYSNSLTAPVMLDQAQRFFRLNGVAFNPLNEQ
jgi:hypothetical protein